MEDEAHRITLLVQDLDAILATLAGHGGQRIAEVTDLAATARAPAHRYTFVTTPGGQMIELVEGEDAPYRAALGMTARDSYWSRRLPQ